MFYIGNIQEIEDILSAKSGVSTFSSYHKCLFRKENFVLGRVEAVRIFKNAIYMVERLNNGNKKVQTLFPFRSTIFVLPVSLQFPFAGISSAIKVYSVFYFQLFHDIRLEFSILLKKCADEILRDETRATYFFNF